MEGGTGLWKNIGAFTEEEQPWRKISDIIKKTKVWQTQKPLTRTFYE